MDVKAWIADDDAQPALLQEFLDRFRTLDLSKETKKGSTVYNGIFNLLVLQGARDWMTGKVPQYGDLDDHHIVPVSKASGNLKGINVHSILNRTPLTRETNRRVINDRLPNEYLPELIKHSRESEAKAILASHFISSEALEILLRKPFTADDFEQFLSARQHTIVEAIEQLLIKDRLDLSPALRELDEELEKTELGLRSCIAVTLNNDPERLPSHISQKLTEVIQKVAKKNAAIDIDNFKDLSTRLQFADLRELQQAITSSATWKDFEARFANKNTLDTKFDQLAELRNSIRHARTVSDITRKEGEAAILWFKKVLGK
jgi:hypothetical protein